MDITNTAIAIQGMGTQLRGTLIGEAGAKIIAVSDDPAVYIRNGLI